MVADISLTAVSSSTIALVGGGLVFATFVGVASVFLAVKKSRMNWYEKNLLEIERSNPEYISFRRSETVDTLEKAEYHSDSDTNSPEEHPQPADNVPSCTYEDIKPVNKRTNKLIRQQSRIHSEPTSKKDSAKIDNHSKITTTHTTTKLLPVLEEDTSITTQLMPIPADMSDKFYVPKSPVKKSRSMYQDLKEAQFDRNLYEQWRQNSAASDEQVLGECGSVRMAINFDETLSLLHVRLYQAADLRTTRVDELPNPYFKVTLQKPESSVNFTHTTRVYRKTRSPEMSEDYCFDVPTGQLFNCKLEILVFDFDQCSVDECIGYCWLSLGRLEISVDPSHPTIFWAEVLPFEESEESFGDVLFSITHLSKAGRLTISIFKCRKLVPHADMTELPLAYCVGYENGLICFGNAEKSSALTCSTEARTCSALIDCEGPTVKVYLRCGERKLKRKKTTTKKHTANPTYNEGLTFILPKQFNLSDIVLDLEVIHETGLIGLGSSAYSRVLGRLHMPLYKCKELWKAVIRGENSHARWYALEKP